MAGHGVWQSKSCQYEGQWKAHGCLRAQGLKLPVEPPPLGQEDQQDGHGRQTWSDGRVYEGLIPWCRQSLIDLIATFYVGSCEQQVLLRFGRAVPLWLRTVPQGALLGNWKDGAPSQKISVHDNVWLHANTRCGTHRKACWCTRVSIRTGSWSCHAQRLQLLIAGRPQRWTRDVHLARWQQSQAIINLRSPDRSAGSVQSVASADLRPNLRWRMERGQAPRRSA